MLKPILNSVLLCYIGIFLVDAFFPMVFFQYMMALLVVISFFLAFPAATRSTKVISILMFVIGFYLMVSYQAGINQWCKAISMNAPVICLVLTVPLLGIVLSYEPYENYLKVVTAKLANSPYGFYLVSSLSVTILSTLLNVASFPLVFQLLKGTSVSFPSQLFLSAMTRGLLPNMLWSPSYISVALSTQYSNVSWFSLVWIGLLAAFAGIILNMAMGWIEYGKSANPPCTVPENENTEAAWQGILRLLSQMGTFIFLIVSLEYYTHKSALVIVPLAASLGPPLLALVRHKGDIFLREFRTFRTRKLPSMANEMLLFSVIGFFGYALGISDIPKYIPVAVTRLGIDTPLMLGTLIVCVVAIPSIAGVHPMISIAAVAATIHPGSVSLTEMQLAGAFLIGYMLFAALSPFSAVNMVISSLAKQGTLIVGLKRNILFALLFAVITGCIFFV